MILIPEEKQIHRAASTPYDLILLSSSDTVEPITCTIMSNGNLKIWGNYWKTCLIMYCF